jgi:hypothetical protein
MPTDTLTDDDTPGDQGTLAAPRAIAPGDVARIDVAREQRLPYPPQAPGIALRLAPLWLVREIARADRDLLRLAAHFAEFPRRRHRASFIGAVVLNAAMLTVLAVYGRVHIFVPNKPADSLSVVFVDLPPAAVPDLRDLEVAPEPEPEPLPVEDPEVLPEPEPAPVPEPDPPAEPAPERDLQDEPEPLPPPLDLTPEPDFTRPTDIENAPFVPDAPAPAAATPEQDDRPGEIVIDGEQTPANDAEPLVSVEPEARQARAEEDAGEEDEEDEEQGAGERAAGELEAREQAPLSERRPPDPATPAGDDSFDEEPVYAGRRFNLPAVDLPAGDTPVQPGSSGVMAIFCPEEFKDKEKAAECAGRTEIRSGWKPGASGEDFSKAAAILRQKREEGDFSGDGVRFGTDLARAANDRARQEDLEDFRKGQAGASASAGVASDPGSASDRNLVGPGQEPNWTLREDPLVDQKDVEKLRKELEAAERPNNPDGE